MKINKKNEELTVNEDLVKTAILAVLNGGLSLYGKMKRSKWFVEFQEEIEGIHKAFAAKYPNKFAKLVEEREAQGTKFNHEGSFMNHLICEIEDKSLNTMIQFIKEKQIIKDKYVCCFNLTAS